MENQSAPKMGSKLSSWLSIAATVVALISSILALTFNEKVKKLEIQSKNLAYVKDSANFIRDREFKFKIYDLVLKAIDEGAKDTLKQRAATIVVSEMVDDRDEDFKVGLLNVIRNASHSKGIQASAANKIYAIQESIKSSEIRSNTGEWRVDVFYVQANQKIAEPTATAVAATLRDAGYKANVRLLPDAVNSRPGYNINSNQIRFEGNEASEAGKIKQLLATGSGLNLQEITTRSATAKYISIFIYK